MANTLNLGVLQQTDAGNAKVDQVGQKTVYNATIRDIADHNAQQATNRRPFVQDDTTDYLFTYEGRGGGRMQRRGLNSLPAEVKGGTSWEVGFPLEDFAAAMAVNDVTFAYMTVNQWTKLVQNIFDQDENTQRYEVLRAIFNSAGRANWKDIIFPRQPTFNVKPLANGDATLYPPDFGLETPITRNHYLGVASAATTLTDNNSPIDDGVALLESAYGSPSGGAPIAAFVNGAQVPSIKTLSSFTKLPDFFVNPGPSTATVSGYPTDLPGTVVGEAEGALIVKWNVIPSGYVYISHLRAPKPLLRRVDTPDSGLGKDLQLVYKREDLPILSSFWRNRYGFGVAERINGVVIDLTASGGANTYTTPAAYA